MNKKRKNLWIYVAAVAVLALVAFAYFKGKNRKAGDKIALEEAQMRTIEERVSASGRIFPIVEVKISSDVSGEVVELYVQEGDSVVQGQVLAKINPDAYVSQVERGVAFVNSSKAQAANSRSQIENINVISLVSWTFPEAIFTWIGSIFNLGSLVSFFTFSSLGFISSKIIEIEFRWKHRNFVPLLFLLSIIVAVMSRVSEAFSYPAFWHWVPIYLLNFLVVIFISFYFGVRLSQKYPGFSFFVMAITITCIVQIIQIYSIYFMTVRIDMRYEMWSKGSAPLYQIADLYFPPTKGYTDQCWERIGEYRLLPKRAN